MVPAAFVPIASLPVTANGKVDRAALPLPNGNRLQKWGLYRAADSGGREELVKILAPLLSWIEVGVNDNFFSSGWTLFAGNPGIARVSERFGVDLTLLKLFDHPTVAEMSAKLRTSFSPKSQASLRTSSWEITTEVPSSHKKPARLDSADAA